MTRAQISVDKQQMVKIALQMFYWGVLAFVVFIFDVVLSHKDSLYFVKWVLVSFPFKLGIFYSYFYFFIPKWLNNRLPAFILITLTLLIGYPLFKIQLDGWVGIESLQAVMLSLPGSGDGYDFWLEFLRRLVTVVLNIGSAFVIRFSVDWFRNRQIAAKMEKYKLQSELAMLRNQVNPHFLFNTLNNIDSMVYKVSSEASEAIMKLSAIMRYMLYESSTPYVHLSKEIDYIQSYFDLERMRVKSKDQVLFSVKLENPNLNVAPMMFIPFVENAFKHATTTADGILVHCSIIESAGEVSLTVLNSFDPDVQRRKDDTGGIGIQNVKRRLDLIYAGRYQMDVSELDKQYRLYLKLNLNED